MDVQRNVCKRCDQRLSWIEDARGCTSVLLLFGVGIDALPPIDDDLSYSSSDSPAIMSDSGGDIDDELLELAGAGAGAAHKKRKRRQPATSSSSKSKTSKKRRADTDSDAESPESEEDGDGSDANPYPLDGKYINEADRQR